MNIFAFFCTLGFVYVVWVIRAKGAKTKALTVTTAGKELLVRVKA
jgi:hypothetical protein